MPLNVQCKRCANLHNDWCDKKHDSPDMDMVRDCQYYRKLTNYDGIISKSPEEMAAQIVEWIEGIDPISGTLYDNDTDGWLDWLKQEATE